MTSPPWVAIRSETLAVSMLDPPPIPTKPSKPPSAANAAASANEAAVGSTRARSHTSVSIPDASIRSRTRSVMPAATTPGSLTSIARFTPRRSSSQPASADAPRPNLSGVASSVKTCS